MDPVKAFLKHIRSECKRHKIKLNLVKSRYVVTSNTKCNGYFDDTERELAVAWGQPEEKRLRILAHEYGHMTQWVDKARVWTSVKEKNYDIELLVEMWVDGVIELNEGMLLDYINRARGVELDCERRTARLLKRFNLPISVDRYIQNANAYVWFWTYMGMRRRWYKIGKEPYNIPAIVEAMPTKFAKSYTKMPNELAQLYQKHLGF
jgi:hypothetical protein